jgi:hypothetical protein
MPFLPDEQPALRASSLDFLRMELGMAVTFLDSARLPHDDPTIDTRNRQNARTAYETVLRFLPRFSLSEREQGEFETKLAAIKAALTELGEVFAG